MPKKPAKKSSRPKSGGSRAALAVVGIRDGAKGRGVIEDSAHRSAGASKFVLLSDLHAHPWAAFSKGIGAKNDRLQRALGILRRSLAQASAEGVTWVFAGDMFHTAGFTFNEVIEAVAEVFADFDEVVKLVVWGNHDARGVGGQITFGQTALATLSRTAKNFFVLDPSLGGVYTDKGGLTFSGAGYQPRSDLLVYGEPADIGVYHQTVRGVKSPTGFRLEEGIPAEELLKRHRVSVVGHVHHWQYHDQKKAGRIIHVPGSPEHHNFGDMGEHGWWIVAVPPKGDATFTFMPGGSPEFRTVATPEDAKDDGNFYRVQNAPPGSILTADAIAIAPTPTAIQSRDALRGARGDQTLEVWLRTEPPAAELPTDRFLAIGRGLLGAQEVGTLRPLRLTKVELHNFCSYADAELHVSPGTKLVLGHGRDYPSNGAGKSTLFEAVYWALFGRMTKGLTGDEVIRRGTSECAVTASFATANDWLTVTRTRGKASRLVVETPDGILEGKSVVEVTEKLSQHLGLTPELYQALGYFSQERLLLFASATDGDRKDMLADLIGLSAFQEASAAAFKKCSELEGILHKTTALRDAAEQRAKSEQARLEANDARVAQWETERAARMQVVTDAVVDFYANESVVREKMMGEERKRLGQTMTDREFAMKANVKEAEAALRSKTPTNTPQELTAVQSEHAQALATIKTVRARIAETTQQRTNLQKRLESQEAALGAGLCPSCGQLVSDDCRANCLAPVLEDIAVVDKQLEDLTARNIPALNAAVILQGRINDVTRGVAALREREAAEHLLKQSKDALAYVAEERTRMEAAATDYVSSVLQQKLNEHKQAAARIHKEKNPFESERTATLERIEAAGAEYSELTKGRKETQEAIAIYDYWRRGFSKQGIQSLLVDEIANMFNEVRGAIFPALTQGVYDVQFSTLSQTKAGEDREKTEFQIFEHGEPVLYEGLSGGQRRRIDVGVMLTLVKAVSTWMQVPGVLGLLVLDEVFGFLDPSGAEGLMEALREMQTQIPSIFVVSHDTQLQALFPASIVVEQDEHGVSRILPAEGEGV